MKKVGKLKLKKEQVESCIRFRKSITRFLRMVNNFKVEKDERQHILQKVIDLRKEIVKIKHASVIFYDFSEKLSLEIEKEKFESMDDETLEKIRVGVENNRVESDMRIKLNQNSPKKFLKDAHYKFIIFHLAEIYADYYGYKKILEDMISKKDGIHPDLLLTYLAGDFSGLEYHTFDHIDDLVNFDDDDLIYVKGLMSNISDFLEKMDKQG